jgi:hypothetical protein
MIQLLAGMKEIDMVMLRFQLFRLNVAMQFQTPLK